MTVEIISWSISTKVWDRAGIKLVTPGIAVRHASVARHVTYCAMRPSDFCYFSTKTYVVGTQKNRLIFFWAPKTHVSVDWLENNQNYTLKILIWTSVCLCMCSGVSSSWCQGFPGLWSLWYFLLILTHFLTILAITKLTKPASRKKNIEVLMITFEHENIQTITNSIAIN